MDGEPSAPESLEMLPWLENGAPSEWRAGARARTPLAHRTPLSAHSPSHTTVRLYATAVVALSDQRQSVTLTLTE
eukprot:7361107-Prymnesium_polylepis.1